MAGGLNREHFTRKFILIQILFLISICVCITNVQAINDIPIEGTETVITTLTGDSSQLAPDIYGNSVVWLDSRDCCGENPNCCGDFRVYHPYLYQIDTGTETLLWSEGEGDPEGLSIFGNRIIWAEMNYTTFTYDIKVYDISSGVISTLGTEDFNMPEPAVSDQFIIWQVLDSGDFTYSLIGFDLSSSITEPFITGLDASLSPSPDISGSDVVWQTYNLTTNAYDVYLYDLGTASLPTLVASNISSMLEPRPRISGDLIVWQAYNTTSSSVDLYLYRETTQESSTILDLLYSPFYPPNPEISGNRVVWVSYQNTNADVYLYDLTNDTRSSITSDDYNQMDPAIDGDRIVWEDRRSLLEDIYMFTIGSPVTCPEADFTASPVVGGLPLTVEFNDTSIGNQENWIWNFGDGNISHELNTSHTYTIPDSYTVSLTISNSKCRDAVQKENLITVGVPPTADFLANPLSGYVPFEVNFTDLSTGSPTEWNWSFGDGMWFNTTDSAKRNPTYKYSSAGSYDVTLLINNSYGTNSLTKSSYISVLNRTGITVSTNILGLSIEQSGDRQFISFDTMNFPEYDFEAPTTLWFVPPPENGIRNMTFYSMDPAGFFNDSGIIKGNITGIVFNSEPIVLEGFSEEIGTDCSLRYLINLSSYPVNAQITAYKWEGAIPSDYQSLLKIAYGSDFAGITDVAYVVQLARTDLNVTHNASILLSVNSTWVENNGGRDNIWVVRIGDDQTGEVLPTIYLYSDGDKNLDYFRADSPRGLSKFALTALHGSGNPLQIIVLIVQQLFNVGSDSNSEGVPTFTPATPTPTLTSLPPAQAPSEGIGHLLTDSEGILSESTEIQAEDMIGTLSIFAGTKALGANGIPLSNISIHRLDAEDLSSLPVEESFQGIAYELLPDGASFDTPLVFTLVIPNEIWSDSKRYSLQWYNRTSDSWEPISTTSVADSHTLIAHITHFSIIGLFSYDIPAATPAATTPIASETPITSPPATSTPLSLCICLLAVMVVVVWWIRGRR
jgi:beta propeller repeat protein